MDDPKHYTPIMSGDPISANAWLDDEVPAYEGDDIFVHAELTDVDEVAVVLCESADDEAPNMVTVYLPRVQAIALAGQIAWAATASQNELPKGHVNA